jgi:hypothetical protein
METAEQLESQRVFFPKMEKISIELEKDEYFAWRHGLYNCYSVVEMSRYERVNPNAANNLERRMAGVVCAQRFAKLVSSEPTPSKKGIRKVKITHSELATYIYFRDMRLAAEGQDYERVIYLGLKEKIYAACIENKLL